MLMPRTVAAPFVLAAAVLVAPVADAADEIRTERIHFKKGATSAVVEGKIKGYETVDYLVGAAAGQQMNASLATKHGATYFNILAPGENEVAMFVGSTSGNQFEGTLPKSGDYKLRVYMMRSAARRNETASYRLEVVITGAQKKVDTPSVDAKVPGTKYHATGNVDCWMKDGAPKGSCPFGVVRQGAGTASVTVTKPDGRTRTIFFEKGKATGSDASQADGGAFRASRAGDVTTVHIGPERYEIFDAIVFGG